VETDEAGDPPHICRFGEVAVLPAPACLPHPIEEFGGLVAGPGHGTSVECREDLWLEKKIDNVEYIKRSVILHEPNQFDICTGALAQPPGG
jgi:hypothetical protein